MTLDWEKIPEQEMKNFKGGEGSFFIRSYTDGRTKIMLGRLPEGCSIGEHVHETNNETCYIIGGTVRFFVDDVPEVVTAGMTHHCPQGFRHRSENAGTEDVLMMCVIPEVGVNA